MTNGSDGAVRCSEGLDKVDAVGVIGEIPKRAMTAGLKDSVKSVR